MQRAPLTKAKATVAGPASSRDGATAAVRQGAALRLQAALGNQATARLLRAQAGPPHPAAAKLEVSDPDDALEIEAERVADEVMRMPEPGAVVPPPTASSGERIDRACAACAAEDELQREESGTPGKAVAPSIVHDVLGMGGRPLDTATRAFMEPRFGHDFGHVRIHDDARAAASARAVNAVAYTHGSDIVFDAGRYAPDTAAGKHLLAHELAHTIQQGSAPAGPGERVQRQDASSDERANDPNFLLCLALCELGIPPSLWRTVVNEILRAVSQEYRDRLGDLRGSQEFQSWRAAFTVMSTFNKLKAILGFLGESRIGPLTIERPAAQAIRRAILARLAERGLESATLELASQIVRKIALAIEIAIAAGCTTYCGATAIANALLDFTSAAINAIAGFVDTLSAIGAGIGQAIVRPLLIARISLDPTNWNLSALPARSQAHLRAIGLAFRLAVTPDSFLASIARPLSSYNIQPILAELAQDINTALQARGGFAQLVTFTPDFLQGLTPLQLVDILKDYRLLSFVEDPEVLADQQQAQQVATPP